MKGRWEQMRRWIGLLGSCLLLVGCSSYQVDRVINGGITVEKAMTQEELGLQDKETKKGALGLYYEEDTSVASNMAEVVQILSEKYPEEYGHYKGNSLTYNLELVYNNEDKNLTKLLKDEAFTGALEETLPGIRAFMEETESNQESKGPKSTIINNVIIKMSALHLFEGARNITYNMPYLSIRNTSTLFVNDYFKTLDQYVPKDQFVTSREHYVAGDKEMLRFYTPAFENRSYFLEYKDSDTDQIENAYYEKGAVGYQLYTKDNSLEKIRVTLRKISNEEVETSYFNPLLEWCEKEWKMTGEELDQVKTLIEEVRTAKRGRHKGEFGNYTYTYKAAINKNKEYWMTSSGLKETVVEFTISPNKL